jgi:hypothetical protein
MDLNFTSWQILDVPCPVSMTPAPQLPIRAAALSPAVTSGTPEPR